MDKARLAATHTIVQGITGTHGAFHTAKMRAAGTNIVAGTSPHKAGQMVDGIPVYATIADIKKHHPIDSTVIFVPAPFAKAAILEAITAKIPLIVCITEGMPIHDMLVVKQQANNAGVCLIGPNCPGILVPGSYKLGIIPAEMGLPGRVGIVSRSGTLTYEATAGLSACGIGQKYIIGIGGDPICGSNFVDCLQLFQSDPEVASIVLIGEIGGTSEQQAAEYIKTYITKPVFVYIAGQSAPMGVQLGHAGAILGSDAESADTKATLLRRAGARVADSIIELVALVK